MQNIGIKNLKKKVETMYIYIWFMVIIYHFLYCLGKQKINNIFLLSVFG